MIANRYVIAIFTVIAVPLLTFALRGNISEFANKYISTFADTSTFEGVVRLTESNRGIFDMLKNGQYEFAKYSALDNVEDNKLAQYFGGSSFAFFPEQKMTNKTGLPSIASTKTPPPKKSGNYKSKPLRYGRSFKVTFIYCGEKEKYAIVNGNLVKQGSKLALGYTLEEIKPDKIKVKTPGGVKWFSINI